MDWSLPGIFDELVARLSSGPMRFRLIVQPMMAIFYGIRCGRRDAAAGRTPFVQALVSGVDRVEHLKSALVRLRGPILFASIVDGVVQFLMFGHLRPLMALTVGTLLMGLPYSAARGLSNRFWSKRLAKAVPLSTQRPV
jgi:hypothetical protein